MTDNTDIITNIKDAPSQLLADLEAEWEESLEAEARCLDAEERYPVSRQVVLQVLQGIVKRLLADCAPKPKPTEDSVEKSIRRDSTIKAAVEAAISAIDDGFDGSQEERDHMNAEVAKVFLTMVLSSVDGRLQSLDIKARLAKMT